MNNNILEYLENNFQKQLMNKIGLSIDKSPFVNKRTLKEKGYNLEMEKLLPMVEIETDCLPNKLTRKEIDKLFAKKIEKFSLELHDKMTSLWVSIFCDLLGFHSNNTDNLTKTKMLYLNNEFRFEPIINSLITTYDKES